jgi:hypothetical protein
MTSLIVPAGAGEASVPVEIRLSLAVAAHLARFKAMSREHTASDLQAYLGWCADRDIVVMAYETGLVRPGWTG